LLLKDKGRREKEVKKMQMHFLGKHMSFWEKVKEGLKRAAEEGWIIAKEGAKVAAKKTEKMAKIAKLRYQIYTLHREAEKRFAEIGGRVYDMANPPCENPFSDAEIKRVIEEIRQIEEKVQSLQEKLHGEG